MVHQSIAVNGNALELEAVFSLNTSNKMGFFSIIFTSFNITSHIGFEIRFVYKHFVREKRPEKIPISVRGHFFVEKIYFYRKISIFVDLILSLILSCLSPFRYLLD